MIRARHARAHAQADLTLTASCERRVYADGDTVIVVWDGRGIATDGLPCENSYVSIMRLNDGQVIDGTAFYDSISFNDLWARVQPG
jgi:uncharacterized protein